MNLLFICRENQMRSRTAETIYLQEGTHHVKSAGTARKGKGEITGELILWADLIFVMEKEQTLIVNRKFAREVFSKKIIILDIPDTYYYMEPELVDLIKVRVSPYLKTS